MSTVSRPSPNGQPAVRPSRTRKEPSGIARLELLINGNRYKVRPTSAGSIVEVRSFRLRKADGTIHIVSETLEGCTCTCLDYFKQVFDSSPAILAVSPFAMERQLYSLATHGATS